MLGSRLDDPAPVSLVEGTSDRHGRGVRLEAAGELAHAGHVAGAGDSAAGDDAGCGSDGRHFFGLWLFVWLCLVDCMTIEKAS